MNDIEQIADIAADRHYRRYEGRIIELEKKVFELERHTKSFMRYFRAVGMDINSEWLDKY